MSPFKIFIILLYLTLRSTQTINTKQNGSFLSTLSHLGTPVDGDLDASEEGEGEDGPKPNKPGSKGLVESVKNLFKQEDRTKSKTQNNVAMLVMSDFKNLLNKKEIEKSYIEVQTSSAILNNNSERGVLHFAINNDQLKDKGGIDKATLKLTKMFDAKTLGLKCRANSVSLYLVNDPGEENRIDVVKGPIRVEVKKNELEVDVTKFFDDLGVPSEESANFLQITDSTDSGGDSQAGNQESGRQEGEKAGAPAAKKVKPDEDDDEDDDDDDYVGSGSFKRSSRSRDSPSRGDMNKFLMLETDPGCYFTFDAGENKPKVFVEMSKNVKTLIRGKVKLGSVVIASVIAITVMGVGGYFLRRNMKTDYTYFYDTQSNGIMAGGV